MLTGVGEGRSVCEVRESKQGTRRHGRDGVEISLEDGVEISVTGPRLTRRTRGNNWYSIVTVPGWFADHVLNRVKLVLESRVARVDRWHRVDICNRCSKLGHVAT